MKIEELASKWHLITAGSSGSIKSIRIDSISIPDLFIGLNPELKGALY